MVETTTSTSKNRFHSPQGHLFPRVSSFALLGLSMVIFCVAILVAYYNVLFSRDKILQTLHKRTTSATPSQPQGEISSEEREVQSNSQDEGSPSEKGTLRDQQNRSPIPQWAMPLMVDLSLVSPGLVAFTAGYMAHGAWILLWPGMLGGRSLGRQFPFPTPYKTYYIQMGLLGTIVGFVIAFAEVDPHAARQSAEFSRQSEMLLTALSTALWSTLMAIVLAYLACPVVEGMYQWLGKLQGIVVGESTTSAIDQLRAKADAAAASLVRLTQSVHTLDPEVNLQQLSLRLATLEGILKAVSEEVAWINKVVGGLTQTTQDLGSRLAKIEGWGYSLETFSNDVTGIKKEINALTQTTQSLEKRLTAVEGWKVVVDGLVSTAKKTAEDANAQLEALSKRVMLLVRKLKRSLE